MTILLLEKIGGGLIASLSLDSYKGLDVRVMMQAVDPVFLCRFQLSTPFYEMCEQTTSTTKTAYKRHNHRGYDSRSTRTPVYGRRGRRAKILCEASRQD
jgi:hypothetical protein